MEFAVLLQAAAPIIETGHDLAAFGVQADYPWGDSFGDETFAVALYLLASKLIDEWSSVRHQEIRYGHDD